MKCELCGKEAEKKDVREIIIQYWTEPKLPITDYVCPECSSKIRQFISWITK
jgi:uncharacterized protein YlaI